MIEVQSKNKIGDWGASGLGAGLKSNEGLKKLDLVRFVLALHFFLVIMQESVLQFPPR
jgi:hypothetical protein